MSKADAEKAARDLWAAYCETHREELRAELSAKTIEAGGHQLRFLERRFGEAPEKGRSLWISLHGGGGAPARVNDQQWQNQIRLYQPEEGIYVAPRAPTDTWNLWHQAHIDVFLQRLITAYLVVEGVNPDRVYIMGYSAGGDGVYQLAPRMSQHFAAASMMAGHPNETRPEGLRNLPFALFMGGKDAAYDRNKIAAKWKVDLAELAASDEGGYPHRVTIFEECGHWMDRKDAVAVPWMAAHTREAWPKKVVWVQDDVTHERMYWLGVPAGTAVARRVISAEVEGQEIRIVGASKQPLELHLHDRLLDLDRPVRVLVGGKLAFEGHVARDRKAMEAALKRWGDPALIPFATLRIDP